ncbi:MAG: methyltransferase domain-containing protein [Rubritepida sp.]|nr:methyltransferase domain-containing protein [Rubritepida sp.]
MLAPGRRGLGFAVGREPLPSLLVARGAEVLATDLDAGDTRAADWISTNQNAARVEDLHWPRLVDREAFLARCAFRAVDMNALPADLRAGGFDFVWSSCSFEHLGSIERGLDFVVAAMDCLAPGGVAVHTTELQLDNDAPPVDGRGTVLFRRRDMEALAARLAARGHAMAPIDYGPGLGLLDGYVDVPPYGARGAWYRPPIAEGTGAQAWMPSEMARVRPACLVVPATRRGRCARRSSPPATCRASASSAPGATRSAAWWR